jgi:phosphomannomutase
MNFVFDVDGTLTPSRKSIDPKFAEWFLDFTKKNKVYLVSGSDYAKTLEQLGETICNNVAGVYSCAGNALYVNGQEVYSNSFDLTDIEYSFLEKLLELSAYPERTGQHIEMRLGLCNFSIVGRGATHEQRQAYVQYDNAINERKNLAELINTQFPRLEATVAGETGIDIYLVGKDKSQIADIVSPFVFFGDKIEIGGNDYSIALRAKKFYKVESWEDTFSILQKEYDVCLSV